jgi:hypothetical protein
MAITTLGAGLELANNLLKLIAPTVSQEQKESLLDAYKKRVSDIQAAGDALGADPGNRVAQLGLGALTRELLNAAGFTAPGLADLDVNVPLDDYLQLLTAVDLLVLLTEQNSQETKS